jgi:hypothetical protein
MSETSKTPGTTRPPIAPPGTVATSYERADLRSNLREDGNQGEGNRTAARRYNDAAERHAHSGAVEDAAAQARASVDAHDPSLAKAEAVGRAPAAMHVSDRAVGGFHRLRRFVRGLMGRPDSN